MNIKSASLFGVSVSILAGSGLALAEVDVYGKANVTLQNSDEAGVSQVELKSNNSRFGVKGDEDLGEGLKAIYQFEWEVDPVDQGNTSENHIRSRNQFVGLQGGFGTLKVGRHDTALKLAQDRFDQFNDLEGDIKNVINGENRVANFVGYTTPVFGNAFSLSVNLVPGEEPEAEEDGIADGTSVSFNYETDALYAALAHDTDIEGADIDTTRLVGIYKFGAAQFGALYQRTDVGELDGDAFGASFAYKLGRNTIKFQYLDGDIHETGRAPLENQMSVGVDRKLGDNTKLFGFYTAGDIGGTDLSNDYLGFGIEHKF